MKDKELIELLKSNYNRKCEEVEKKSKNMHMDLKFASKFEPIENFIFVDQKKEMNEREVAIVNAQ